VHLDPGFPISPDELAADCAADRTYDGLFVAAPMPVVGASGSPLNPIFMK
jgi:hypothetical protein